MSKQQEQTDSDLIQSVTQQLNLYDNLFPEVESRELRVLFALLRIYLARCDNPQLRREDMMVDPALMKRLTLPYFDPFSAPISRAFREALVTRLSSIRKYRITNAEVVRRALVTCLYEEERGVRRKHKTYLDVFMRNPRESYTAIARELGVTPQAVSTACRSLQKSDIKFWGYIDYPAFKLRHFAVFFTAMAEYRGKGEYLRKLFFDNLPFTLSLNTDVYEGNNWASFVIPNQEREIREFKKSLGELVGEVFRDLTICEMKSISTGSNLEFFDGKRWFFDPQLWTYGLFEFVRENKEIIRKASGLRYSTQPIRFDRIDFLVASVLASDLKISHHDIKQRLSEYGYHISRPTVTRRVARLFSPKEEQHVHGEEPQAVIHPYMTYDGLGLNNLSIYLIECDEKYVEEMFYAVCYLPYYFLYRTDKGMLLSVKSPGEDIAKFNYMIKGLNEIRVVAYSNRFQNMGIRHLAQLHDKWDEARQKWTCADGELNFVRRFESMP